MAVLQTALASVSVDKDVVSLSPSLRYLEDTTRTLTVEDLLKPNSGQVFKATGMEVPSFGFRESVFWFRTELSGQLDAHEWVLELGYPHLDYVDIFVVQDDGTYSQFQIGDRYVFSKRHRPHRTLTAPIMLSQGQTITLLVRVETESSIQVPLTLFTERAFGDHAATENFGLGIYYGLTLVMVIFNLVLFFSLPDRSYLYYVGYLTCLLFFVMSFNGTLGQWLFPDSPGLTNFLMPLLIGATGIFLVLFMTSFLQLPERWPAAMPLVWFLLLICVLQSASAMFASYGFSTRFGVLTIVLLMVAALVVGFICLQRGFPAARYFVLAWACFLLGGIVTALSTMGVFPARFITTYAVQIGSAIEITLLSLALGQRFEVIRQEAATIHRKQVDVERRLNVELETKMHIFSDVSHRLNNPLNFISGGIENLADLVASHRERLWALFPPEGQRDADAQSMIDTFDDEFRQLADYLADVTAGAMRTATFVREMRGLSGVDGANFDPVLLADVVDRGMERVRDNMGSNLADRLTVNEMRPQLEASSVLGNVYLHAMVLSLAVETLLDHADEDAPLSLTIDLVEVPDEGVEQLKLLVSPGFYGGGSPTMLQALELLTSLLSPYGGRVTMVPECSAGEGGVLLSLVSEMTLLPRYSKAQGLRPD